MLRQSVPSDIPEGTPRSLSQLELSLVKSSTVRAALFTGEGIDFPWIICSSITPPTDEDTRKLKQAAEAFVRQTRKKVEQEQDQQQQGTLAGGATSSGAGGDVGGASGVGIPLDTVATEQRFTGDPLLISPNSPLTPGIPEEGQLVTPNATYPRSPTTTGFGFGSGGGGNNGAVGGSTSAAPRMSMLLGLSSAATPILPGMLTATAMEPVVGSSNNGAGASSSLNASSSLMGHRRGKLSASSLSDILTENLTAEAKNAQGYAGEELGPSVTPAASAIPTPLALPSFTFSPVIGSQTTNVQQPSGGGEASQENVTSVANRRSGTMSGDRLVASGSGNFLTVGGAGAEPGGLAGLKNRPQVVASISEFLEAVSNRVMQSTPTLDAPSSIGTSRVFNDGSSTVALDGAQKGMMDTNALAGQKLIELTPLEGDSFRIFPANHPLRVALYFLLRDS